ncbi:DUF1189 family protein [Clostridium sp. PL3]|uniref:DUF1189 family protein n=1 Tax=Clostridium thailandense TaxID=2794346 RepID=A0A949TV13_9CLOT|nr:DUF1189 family protein [Clostridium thailandense]
MIQKKNKVQTQVTDFKSFQGATINKNMVNRYLPSANAIIPFIFLGNIFVYFFGEILSSLFLAIFALIINGIFKTNLRYGQLYSLSIYALTTPIIIGTLFKNLFQKPFDSLKEIVSFYAPTSLFLRSGQLYMRMPLQVPVFMVLVKKEYCFEILLKQSLNVIICQL